MLDLSLQKTTRQIFSFWRSKHFSISNSKIFFLNLKYHPTLCTKAIFFLAWMYIKQPNKTFFPSKLNSRHAYVFENEGKNFIWYGKFLLIEEEIFCYFAISIFHLIEKNLFITRLKLFWKIIITKERPISYMASYFCAMLRNNSDMI